MSDYSLLGQYPTAERQALFADAVGRFNPVTNPGLFLQQQGGVTAADILGLNTAQADQYDLDKFRNLFKGR